MHDENDDEKCAIQAEVAGWGATFSSVAASVLGLASAISASLKRDGNVFNSNLIDFELVCGIICFVRSHNHCT